MVAWCNRGTAMHASARIPIARSAAVRLERQGCTAVPQAHGRTGPAYSAQCAELLTRIPFESSPQSAPRAATAGDPCSAAAARGSLQMPSLENA